MVGRCIRLAMAVGLLVTGVAFADRDECDPNMPPHDYDLCVAAQEEGIQSTGGASNVVDEPITGEVEIPQVTPAAQGDDEEESDPILPGDDPSDFGGEEGGGGGCFVTITSL